MKDKLVEKLYDRDNHVLHSTYGRLLHEPEETRPEVLVEIFRMLAESHEKLTQDYIELIKRIPTPSVIKME